MPAHGAGARHRTGGAPGLPRVAGPAAGGRRVGGQHLAGAARPGLRLEGQRRARGVALPATDARGAGGGRRRRRGRALGGAGPPVAPASGGASSGPARRLAPPSAEAAGGGTLDRLAGRAPRCSTCSTVTESCPCRRTSPRRPPTRALYQTVYAAEPGSAAAPTAGLHFTTGLLERLATARAWRPSTVTLHVGLDTFRPITQPGGGTPPDARRGLPGRARHRRPAGRGPGGGPAPHRRGHHGRARAGDPLRRRPSSPPAPAGLWRAAPASSSRRGTASGPSTG